MIRTTLAAAAALTMLAPPAPALDLSAMTDAEKAEFGAAVRDYLLENPEVLTEAIAVLEERNAADQAASDQELVAAHATALFEDPDSFVGGNPDGDITIVEFLDYRCGYCRRAHPEVADLIESDGEIRIIVKEFPILGPESIEASRFAIAALQTEGPDAYKAIGDALMSHRGGFDRDTLAGIAEDAGYQAAPIVARMDAPEVTAVIAANHALGQAMGINGTPSFVFEDQMVRGYIPLDSMRQVVAALRAD